ncbi:hypothetical protein ATY41_01295 [Leifsonia xyli subsp. xyli]|uniref:Uncharacterized protein n=2 Tax=Leifsonia xyli TaxID=1575 RepID=A0A1E2SNB1_LEIXY|nr:hypothetical protein ATY41_01295 [Leifsonia xyli subsp. xyli]
MPAAERASNDVARFFSSGLYDRGMESSGDPLAGGVRAVRRSDRPVAGAETNVRDMQEDSQRLLGSGDGIDPGRPAGERPDRAGV